MNLARIRQRRGFTLTELLVVIAIMAILGTLLANGLFRYLNASKITRTEETMRKIDAAFEGQWKAAIDQAKREPIPEATLLFCGNDQERARVFHIKMRLRFEFPQSFAECRTVQTVNAGGHTYVYSPKAAYVQEIGLAGNAATTHEEAAILLVLSLKHSRGGAKFDPEMIGGGAMTSVNVPALNKSFSVFQDAWRTPIAYNRWIIDSNSPILQEMSNPPYANGTNRDALDPTGRLRLWANPGTGVASVLGYSPTDNLNRSPVIYSAGPNRRYFDSDDLYHFRLKASGKGN